jgi:PAS domain S-box-containing protein
MFPNDNVDVFSDTSGISFERFFRKHDAVFLLANAETGKLVDANDAALRFYGYSRQKITSMEIGDFVKLPPDEWEAERQRALNEERKYFIVPHLLANGTIRNVEVHTTPIFLSNKTYLFSVIHDITDRKLAEKALRESEERLRTIVEASLDAIIAVDAEGRLVLFNGAAQELFQYSEQEVLNQPVAVLLREEIGKIHQERLVRFLKKGVGQCGHIGRRMEKLFRRKDGSRFEAEVSMSGGRLDGLRLVVLVIHDITERKQTEEALRRAEENFRRSLDDSPLGVRIVTIEGETIYANRAILDIYGYESIDELRETPVIKRYTPESFAEFQIRREKRKRGDNDPSEYEIRIIGKDGEIRHLQVFRKKILWDGKRQFQVIYHDITRRKRAEEALHASLREKEILLSEIHHRVKNNMQVVSGLLDLQMRSSNNPELIAMFHESQRRIRSMALIHEKIYGSKDFARIDMAGYASTLSQELFQSHKISPGEIDLIIQTDNEVYVDIGKAIPCGLILNELISNALKHAFPGNGQGEINIIIRKTKNKEIKIVVRDNGSGLPADVDIHKPQTVGLHLVNGLVKNQIDGQIEFSQGNGTEFRIIFPL